MSPEQHAKVLEALEALINDPGDDHIKSSTWDKAREALSIMRAVQVGERNRWPDRTAVRSPSPHEVVTLNLYGKSDSAPPTEHEVKP